MSWREHIEVDVTERFWAMIGEGSELGAWLAGGYTEATSGGTKFVAPHSSSPDDDPWNEDGYLYQHFTDVAAILSGTGANRPEPTVGERTDGEFLVYPGTVNFLIGPPESGKSWCALVLAAEVLKNGGRVFWMDMDHNGAAALVYKLLDLGVPVNLLTDLDRFRLAEPDDADSVRLLIPEVVEFSPTLAVIDSVGEVIPAFGGNSNSDDDWTKINREVLTPLAGAGAAVVAIDHVAKNSESARFGSTGTQAKKRSVGGVMLRVTVTRPFTPGRGGRADLTIVKDRPGALRAVSISTGKQEPLAATFELLETDDGLGWKLWAPDPLTAPGSEFDRFDADIDSLDRLVPAPTSVRDVKARMGWGSDRATRAFRAWEGKRSDAEPVA